jgi:hypothetical protein
MKKIIFFTQNRWAFGSIHHALCKELFKHNIYANLLDWTQPYTHEEFKLLLDTYDLIVTMPDAVMLTHRTWNVPLNKIVAIAHEQWDILLAKKQDEFDFYPHIQAFGVISQSLYNNCKDWNMSVMPKIVETGVHFDLFYAKPSEQLKTIGYGGAKGTLNFYGVDRKRGHLVEKACSGIENIELQAAGSYNYLCMPGYYKTVDSVIMSSLEEAGGLPMFEAAAAGRLPIGTPVGFFKDNAPKGGGVMVPLDEEGFIKEASEAILYYRDNPKAYVDKCLEVQAFAKDNYDWSKKISMWLDILA